MLQGIDFHLAFLPDRGGQVVRQSGQDPGGKVGTFAKSRVGRRDVGARAARGDTERGGIVHEDVQRVLLEQVAAAAPRLAVEFLAVEAQLQLELLGRSFVGPDLPLPDLIVLLQHLVEVLAGEDGDAAEDPPVIGLEVDGSRGFLGGRLFILGVGRRQRKGEEQKESARASTWRIGRWRPHR